MLINQVLFWGGNTAALFPLHGVFGCLCSTAGKLAVATETVHVAHKAWNTYQLGLYRSLQAPNVQQPGLNISGRRKKRYQGSLYTNQALTLKLGGLGAVKTPANPFPQ